MTLLDLFEEHRAAFEYDWRNRFHLGLSRVPAEMGYSEACRLTDLLMLDPSSQVGAAIAEWQYPLSREGLTLLNLYDLQHRSKAKRTPQDAPRPWDTPPKVTGAGTSLTVAEYMAIKASLTQSDVRPPQPRDARGRFAKRL